MQKERETYEVIVEDGRLVYKQSKMPVATTEGSKWIFVLSTSRVLYVGQVNVRHRKPAFGTSACMYVCILDVSDIILCPTMGRRRRGSSSTRVSYLGEQRHPQEDWWQ